MSPWFIALSAFAAGYVLAHFAPFRLEIEEGQNMPKRFIPKRGNRIAFAVLLVYVLMTVTSLVAFSEARDASAQIAKAVQCQSDYNRAYYLASKARTDATQVRDQARDAYDTAVQEYLDAAGALVESDAPTPEELKRVREATVHYRVAVRELRKTNEELELAREKSPYPSYPTNYCEPDKE